jgi:aryl-alcohol dehydrogenase-like predicted oxidoreductase
MSSSTNGWSVLRIVSKQAWLSRDRRLLAATNLIYVKMNTSGTVMPSRHVKKSHALCLLLPDFAKEFGAATWSSFFLKWVISNPAVTMALPATTNPDHLVENVAAMRGPLPDSAMRRRMVA